MILTESGLYIPNSEVAYIIGENAYLRNGAKIKIKVRYNRTYKKDPFTVKLKN